jgi:hypothetical protein
MWGLPRIAEELAEPIQSAEDEARRRRAAAANLLCDVGDFQSLEIVQLYDSALVIGQPRQSTRQEEELFAANHSLTGR